MLPLIPLRDEALVLLPPPAEQVTGGGVVIPEAVGEQASGGRGYAQEGTVLATGLGRVSRKGAVLTAEVAPGDRVLIKRHMGTEVHIGKHADGKPAQAVLVKPEDILLVIEEP